MAATRAKAVGEEGRRATRSASARWRVFSGNAPTAHILPDLQEAWEIASELVLDLGADDALVWADDYMRRLSEQNDRHGMQRWAMVVSALAELVNGSLH